MSEVERMTFSFRGRATRRVREQAALTKGGASGYLERLGREDELRDAMRRGEVWGYSGLLGRRGQSDKRLIVSADVVNASDDVATCYAVHVVDTDPGSLLAVDTALRAVLDL